VPKSSVEPSLKGTTTMTRKDYILIAEALRVSAALGIDPRRKIAAALAQDNPRFDVARFLAAAGNPPTA